MGMFQLPFKPQQNQTVKLTINGNDYTFKLQWNDRGSFWELDIFDASLEPIVCGIPLVTGVDLLAQYPYMLLAQAGKMVCFSKSVSLPIDAIPNYDNLGIDSFVYLLTPPDV